VTDTPDFMNDAIGVQQTFSSALRAIVSKRGYRTIRAFRHALGLRQARITSWFIDGKLPAPAELGCILALLRPNESELDELLAPWAAALIATRRPSAPRKPQTSPLGQCMEAIAFRRGLTLRRAMRVLGFGRPSYSIWFNDGPISLEALAAILERADAVLDLSETEVDALGSAVAETITQAAQRGRPIVAAGGRTLVRIYRKDASGATYTGGEAARELGISRQRVTQLRRILEIDHFLITPGDLQRMREYRAQGRHGRRRSQRSA
jgi:hypothetical protein